jgi:hypothetical protein
VYCEADRCFSERWCQRLKPRRKGLATGTSVVASSQAKTLRCRWGRVGCDVFRIHPHLGGGAVEGLDEGVHHLEVALRRGKLQRKLGVRILVVDLQPPANTQNPVSTGKHTKPSQAPENTQRTSLRTWPSRSQDD